MQDGSATPIGNFFRNKWVRLILVIDVLAIIAIIVFSIDKATKTAIVSFNVAPVDATITVNGSGNYKNIGQPLENGKNSGQSYSFAPGTYEIQISHPDLDTKTFIVDLADNSNTTITTFLSKDNDFYFYTLKDNFSSFNRLASIASVEDNQTTDHDTSAGAFIANFQKEYGLYSTALPVIYSEYNDDGELVKYISIRAGHNCAVTLCLKTNIYNNNDKPLVESLLEDAGFNVENFEIEYQIY